MSTEEQAQNGYSLAEQKEACVRRAKELGAASTAVYADEGVTGATLDRPGLAALRRDAKQGKIDLIVCRDPDRLSRKLAHQLLITEELEKAGVRLEFLDFDWKDTPEGRLFYAVRGAIAEYEREKIRERTALGRVQKARQGGVPVGCDIYGYRYDPETGAVAVKEDEAAVVRGIFERFVAGWGYNTIAQWLNEMGVPTRRRKGMWHKQVIAQIVANRAYAGTWYYRKRDYTGGRRGEPLPPEQWIPVPVPAVIPEELWLAAQEKAREARRLWAYRGRHDYLLSGIITCGDCGLPMSGTWIRWWGKPDRRYTCHRRTEGARHPGCRPRKMVLARVLEESVWCQVKSWLADPEALAREALAGWPEIEGLKEELERLGRLLAEAQRGRENVLAALAAGLFELDAKTKKILADLKRKVERLAARKEEFERALAEAKGAERSLAVLRPASAALLARVDDWPFEERRDLVRALVRQVIVIGRPKPRDACGDVEIALVPRAPDAVAIANLLR